MNEVCQTCGVALVWSGGELDEERYEPNCDCEAEAEEDEVMAQVDAQEITE